MGYYHPERSPGLYGPPLFIPLPLLREDGQRDRLLNNLFIAILTKIQLKATTSLTMRV